MRLRPVPLKKFPKQEKVRHALRLCDGRLSAWMVAAMPPAAARWRGPCSGLLLLVCAAAARSGTGRRVRGSLAFWTWRSLSSVSGGAGVEKHRDAFRTEDPVEQRWQVQIADFGPKELRGLGCVGAEEGSRPDCRSREFPSRVQKSEASWPIWARAVRVLARMAASVSQARRPSGSVASASSTWRGRDPTRRGARRRAPRLTRTDVRRSTAMTGSLLVEPGGNNVGGQVGHERISGFRSTIGPRDANGADFHR